MLLESGMRKLILPVLLLLGLAATPALAALQVDVTQGNAQPLPLSLIHI